MPSSIVLSHVALNAPDGRLLVPDIDLTFAVERTGLIGRNGIGKTTLLNLIAGSRRAEPRGTENGTMGLMRQSVQDARDETLLTLFGVEAAMAMLQRAESGRAIGDELAGIDWTLESRLVSVLSGMGLDLPLDTRLAQLSGGQITQARFAALIFANPDFLLLDEPTNNLDRDGRRTVIDMLANWRRGAIIVSHDRELLDGMDAIVELTSLGATRYGGNWSHYRISRRLELASAGRDLADAEKRLAVIDRKAQDIAEAKARKDSGGRRKQAKGDMPRILAGGRKDRSEDSGGKSRGVMERKRAQATEDSRIARSRIEVLQPFKIDIPSTRLSEGKVVLEINGVSAGYDPARPILKDLTLSLTGPERLAVVGSNGSGKTTLLRLICGHLQPQSGTVRVMTDMAMLDQRVGLLDPATSVLENFRRINSAVGDNASRAALAQFMFRADAAMQIVASLSGGQLLRAGLACVLGGRQPPGLLIIDEPTNHLDVQSIETIEAGLRSYDGALIVVSHDEAFLEAVRISRRFSLAGPA